MLLTIERIYNSLEKYLKTATCRLQPIEKIQESFHLGKDFPQHRF